MKPQQVCFLLLALLFALYCANSALAMTSTNYRMDWNVPLTGGAGGSMSSTNYHADLTVGQTVVGASSSTNYAAGLGYWYGALDTGQLHLPALFR